MTTYQAPETVDENIARISSFIDGTLFCVFLFTTFKTVIFFILIDYALKLFPGTQRFSPSMSLGKLIAVLFGIQPTHIQVAPKLFTVRVCFLVSITICTLYLQQIRAYPEALAMLMLFSTYLDAVMNKCPGSLLYQLFSKPETRLEKLLSNS